MLLCPRYKLVLLVATRLNAAIKSHNALGAVSASRRADNHAAKDKHSPPPRPGGRRRAAADDRRSGRATTTTDTACADAGLGVRGRCRTV